MKNDCPNCKGLGWVCQNHPRQAWSDRCGCTCGAGMLCKCVRDKPISDGVEEPDLSQVLDKH